MKNEINILCIEDIPNDAMLIDDALRRGGLPFQSKRVDSKEKFLHELKNNPPDIILSDHGLPSFDGFAALAIAHEKCPDVPFIFVTNSLTREMEVETFAVGVTDYILKSRLDTLAPAVCHALWEAEKRRLHDLMRLLPICAGCKKIRDEKNQWMLPEVFFHDHLNIKFTHGICPECAPKFFPKNFPKNGNSAK